MTPRVPSFLRDGGLLRKLPGRRATERRSTSQARRLRIEPLEGRQMLSVNNLVISEIMYNPHPSGSAAQIYEYVEVQNTGATAVSLSGVSFTEGIAFNFTGSTVTTLGPGEFVVVVRDLAGFRQRYPSPAIKVAGVYSGGLDNAGERITLTGPGAVELASIRYRVADPWSTRPNGGGSSLQIVNPLEDADERYSASNWIASRELHGTPGRAGLTAPPPVIINEILSNDNVAINEVDKVELHNVTDYTVNIGGWYLSDKDTFDLLYQIPAGTTIAPWGYRVFDANQFGVGANAFGLSSAGESLSLLRVESGQTIFVDHVAFGPSELSVSFARIPNATGELVPAVNQTFGAANPAHRVSPVVISEIMYSPPGTNVDDLEFIELHNRGATTANLANWRIRRDIDFDFPVGATLPAGERIIVLRFDPVLPANATLRNAFQAAYGITLFTGTGTPPAGQVRAVGGYGAAGATLSNRQARLELREQIEIRPGDLQWVLRDLALYQDGGEWPRRADGRGSSVERLDSSLVGSDPRNWRASFEYNGTPGRAPNAVATVVINEVLAHVDFPQLDAIELYNQSGSSVNVGGWYLTDSPTNLFKYRIPDNTILQPGQYITFNESHFNTGASAFALSGSRGDTISLIQATGTAANPVPVRFADEVTFGASFNAVSLGRWPNGTGQFFPMREITFQRPGDVPGPGQVYTNGANTGPLIGDVIVSEVMYHPGGEAASEFEYIELYNRTSTAINLGPVEPGTGWTARPLGWQLTGAVQFEFTAAHSIPGFGTLLVVNFNPQTETAKLNAFRTRYGLAAGTVIIVGPYTTPLNNVEGVIRLERPDFAQTILAPADAFTPMVLHDRVNYRSTSPWPAGANGTGQSLTRTNPIAFGDFAASWSAAAPTPGSVSSFVPPKVSRVVLSGSTWTSSFLNLISTPGAPAGYAVPTGSSQTVVLPWGKTNQISMVFDSDVVISQNALALRGLDVLNYTVSPHAIYNPATRTATWQVSEPIIGDRLIIELDANKVTSLYGTALDGDWTDNVSVFPSGDGAPGGNFKFRFNVLVGDANRNGNVQSDDFNQVRLAMFTRTGVTGYSALRDLDGNGVINVIDILITRDQQGRSLPSGTVNSPAAAPTALDAEAEAATSVASASFVEVRSALADRARAAAGVIHARLTGGLDTPLRTQRAETAAREWRASAVDLNFGRLARSLRSTAVGRLSGGAQPPDPAALDAALGKLLDRGW